jgi:hypothetical protein
VRSFYALLLHLFPKSYREEYGEELRAVFGLALDQALKIGWVEIASVILRELISLPSAIVYEHLREMRKVHNVKKFGTYFDFTYGSRREFLTSLYPFILIGFIHPLMNVLMRSSLLIPQSVLVNGIGIVIVASLGILLLIGIVTGLPRWSLPYVGFLFSLFSVYGFSEWLNRRVIIPFQSLYDRSWFVGQVAYQGSLWVGLTVVAFLLVVLVGSTPLLSRFKKDWTLLAFLLYGATPFALLITFDDYVNEELYVFIAFLILATGLWSYLHANDSRRQFWALFNGLTISLFFAAMAKAILFSSPSWPWPRNSFSWQNEMMSTVIMWGWIALSMLVPLSIKLLSHLKSSSQAT